MEGYEIRVMRGREVRDYVGDLAALRIAVFREYPYLYDGTPDYEQHYLQRYVACERCVFVLVMADGQVVGASTGLPLADEVDAFRQPFMHEGYDANQIFYFGESVLLPKWRGQGIGHRFFDEREAYARELGPYPITAFCAVERPVNDSRRPADYHPLDTFWKKRGYRKKPQLQTTFEWQEIGETEETPKPMIFWIKQWEASP